MADLERRAAVSLDFDGVLFPRPPIQGGGLLDYVQPWKYNKPFQPKHAPILSANRVMQTRQLTAGEVSELQRHERRHVKPEVAALVSQMRASRFGNTGRPNSAEMVAMTRQRIQEAGLDPHFEGFFFKPEGVGSDESKYWALTELQEMGFSEITHYDDNARTVRLLAPALPAVRFVIVQDLTSGLLFSRREMERHPNVARIAIRRNGNVDVVHMSAQFGDLPVPAR